MGYGQPSGELLTKTIRTRKAKEVGEICGAKDKNDPKAYAEFISTNGWEEFLDFYCVGDIKNSIKSK